MTGQRELLRLDDSADVPGTVIGIQAVPAHAGPRHSRRDLGLEPRQKNPAVVAGRGDVEGARESLPREPVRVADALAGQRSVAEAGQSQVGAGRCAEHVTRRRRVDARLAHETEDRVARAQ